MVSQRQRAASGGSATTGSWERREWWGTASWVGENRGRLELRSDRNLTNILNDIKVCNSADTEGKIATTGHITA